MELIRLKLQEESNETIFFIWLPERLSFQWNTNVVFTDFQNSATKLCPSALLAASLDIPERMGKKIFDNECFNISVINFRELIAYQKN